MNSYGWIRLSVWTFPTHGGSFRSQIASLYRLELNDQQQTRLYQKAFYENGLNHLISKHCDSSFMKTIAHQLISRRKCCFSTRKVLTWKNLLILRIVEDYQQLKKRFRFSVWRADSSHQGERHKIYQIRK